MNVTNLKSKWEDITEFKNNNGYKALRITSDCIPDLYIATDENGFRYFLLFLPSNIEVKLKGTDKEKLKIAYDKEKNIILIKLNDLDFVDLFNDLIVSLYSKIKEIANPNLYSKELIYSFYKWAEFFEDKLGTKLSNEEIKGLFGELFILNQLIEKSNPNTINAILDSWKGPYDNTNDFVLDKKNIEIKTKDESKSFVKISSEYQLENEFDKGLELIVVSIKYDMLCGLSINDLLKTIIQNVRQNLGDLSILYQTLGQKGLTIESTKEYNNHRFIVTKTNSYDCNIDNFPKLSVSNIPEEITRLNYILRLTTLKAFLIEEKKY